MGPSAMCPWGRAGCPRFEACLESLRLARQELPEFLSAVEVMDAETLRCVHDNLRLRLPLDQEHPFCLLVELAGERPCLEGGCGSPLLVPNPPCGAGSDEAVLEESLLRFVDLCMSRSHVSDGTMAKDSAKVQVRWPRPGGTGGPACQLELGKNLAQE